MKKTILFISIFLFFTIDLNAYDGSANVNSDSTNYSRFNMHCGVGVLNGTRLGINYRFNKHISINVDYGVSTYIFFGAYASVLNTDLNYHFSNNSLVSSSITLWKWGVNYRPEYAYIPSLNVGYLFYNPAKSINSLQLRVGLGLYYHKNKFEEIRYAVIPNLDIIVGFQF